MKLAWHQKKTYNLLNSLMDLEFDLISDKYNLILAFINELIKPKIKYYRLTEIKKLSEKNLKIYSVEKSELCKKYVILFENGGIKLNKKSKNINDAYYILNNALKQIQYKIRKHKDVLNNVNYSIIKN
jgi:hypothetical protein